MIVHELAGIADCKHGNRGNNRKHVTPSLENIPRFKPQIQ
jgi:hypothetical protein